MCATHNRTALKVGLPFLGSKVKIKWNESGCRPLLCTYRLNWAMRTSWGGEMSEMTLPARHRIRNSNPVGLRPSTLPLCHGGSPQYWVLRVDGGKFFLFLLNRWDRETNPKFAKGSGANNYPRAPAHETGYKAAIYIGLHICEQNNISTIWI